MGEMVLDFILHVLVIFAALRLCRWLRGRLDDADD